MQEKWYHESANKFPDIECDNFIVMPNHFHGIIIINETVGASLVGAQSNKDAQLNYNNYKSAGMKPAPALGEIVGLFKSMITNEDINGVKKNNWPSFSNRLWQRNYYEHIVRNEEELNRIREYIISNPLKWANDENYQKEMETI